MKVIEKDSYKILEDEKNDMKNFLLVLKNRLAEFKKDNLAVDLLKHKKLTSEELLNFLPISNQHTKNKKSFVIVNNAVNIDDVPAELLVVPSLQEAEDLIQMEEIERELGF